MMKLAISLALAALALAAAPSGAAAQDSYEALAKKARRVDGDGLAALFWSQLEDCGKAGSDFARRQCLGLRAARRAQLAGETFVVAGGGAALHPDGYDAAGKKLPLAIDACVACDGGVEVDGKKRLVTGKGKRTISGGALRAAPLGKVAIAAATPDAAEAWKKDALPRVRSEFVVRLPGSLETWKAGDLSGFGVEVVAYRVWDPCDGRVLAARPAAARAVPDKSTCPAEADKPAVAEQPKKPAEPAAPAEPDRLSATAVNAAMAPVRPAAQKCFETYGVAGKAVLHITFDKNGQITALGQDGDFADTPTGSCIEKAVRTVVFPASRKASTKISYPLTIE